MAYGLEQAKQKEKAKAKAGVRACTVCLHLPQSYGTKALQTVAS